MFIITNPVDEPLAETYTIDIPGTDKVLTLVTRDSYNSSTLHREMMSVARYDNDRFKDDSLLAAVTMDTMESLGLILQDAENASDIVEFAQQEIPYLIYNAWDMSDYYAERTGITTVYTDSIYEWVYADNGSRFISYMVLQLLSIAERKNCVAKGVPYEGPTIINSRECLDWAESLCDEHGLIFY